MTYTQTDRGHLIGIIGAGPAGLYAAKKLAEAGAHVVLFTAISNLVGWPNMAFFPPNTK